MLLLAVIALHGLPSGDAAADDPVQDNNVDFQQIFDGRTLDGWEGDPTYWSVEDGALVTVKQAPDPVCLVRLAKDRFFNRVRAKLQWGDLADREQK